MGDEPQARDSRHHGDDLTGSHPASVADELATAQILRKVERLQRRDDASTGHAGPGARPSPR